MKRIIALISTIIFLINTSSGQSVGLVLSGGGAKGIAHIGVIQALEDNNIPIDYITGTSMGAIVGGLYAVGYSPAEMMDMLLSKEFSYWSTGVIDENLTYYFAKPTPSPALMRFNLNVSDSVKISANILPTSLINPLPMNFAFMELFAAYTAQCGGNFNNLFVPFRCVSSDVFNKRKIVSASGSLGDAIRASMSFPVVFKPIELDGVVALDGGIYDNFPVDVMREDFAPGIMIGVDVSQSKKLENNNLIDQIEAMVIQNKDYSLPESEGIKISVSLEEIGLLDFPKARIIYQIGYDKAISMMDSIKSRIHSRISTETRTLYRNVFKSKTPDVIFDSVSVTGPDHEQADYIKYLFRGEGRRDTLDMKEAKSAFYRAISSGKIKDLVPNAKYNPGDGMFDLSLKATVRDNVSLGVGGWITSSTNSMIFLSAGYHTLDFNSFDADINGWIGQSYYAGSLNAKMSLLTRIPSYLKLQGVMSQQKFYENDVLFYSDALPSFIVNYDNFVRIKYGLAVGRLAKFEIGLGYGYLNDKFYQSNVIDYTKEKQDEGRYSLGQVYACFETNTLNNLMYPTAGQELKTTAIGAYGRIGYYPHGDGDHGGYTNHGWVQVEIEGSKYFPVSEKFILGGRFDVMASTKKLFSNYTATIVQAPAFAPTPATSNYFNPAFRSNSFAAVGILPIWSIIDNLQLRSEFYLFMPFRKIFETKEGNHPYYGSWFSNPSFLGELSVVYNLPFASVSVYGNYLSFPAKNWNFGISFGLLFQAPKFLR